MVEVGVQPAAATAQGEGRVNDAVSWHIDKSTLPLSEPRRYRDRAHLQFVAAQPCLVCGRSPSDPHHLRFMQPRALGRRVSDEFAVPLCRTHHRALHRRGDEAAWWMSVDLDPVVVAQRLWHQTRVYGAAANGNIAVPLPTTEFAKPRRHCIRQAGRPMTATATLADWTAKSPFPPATCFRHCGQERTAFGVSSGAVRRSPRVRAEGRTRH